MAKVELTRHLQAHFPQLADKDIVVVDIDDRSLADVNHTVAIWKELHARFIEHTGLAAPPVAVLSTLMRKSKKQVPKYLASLQAGNG